MRKRIAIGGTGLVFALGGGAWAATAAQTDDPGAGTTPAAEVSANPSETGRASTDAHRGGADDMVTPSELPADVTEAVASRGIILDPVEQDPKIATPEAVQRAADGIETMFGADDKSQVVAVALASMTTPGQGWETQPDPTQESKIDPEFVNRLVWVVAIKGYPVTAHGVIDVKGENTAPQQSGDIRGTLVATIDAESDEFLNAIVY